LPPALFPLHFRQLPQNLLLIVCDPLLDVVVHLQSLPQAEYVVLSVGCSRSLANVQSPARAMLSLGHNCSNGLRAVTAAVSFSQHNRCPTPHSHSLFNPAQPEAKPSPANLFFR
jgi:hypothetical protein